MYIFSNFITYNFSSLKIIYKLVVFSSPAVGITFLVCVHIHMEKIEFALNAYSTASAIRNNSIYNHVIFQRTLVVSEEKKLQKLLIPDTYFFTPRAKVMIFSKLLITHFFSSIEYYVVGVKNTIIHNTRVYRN